MKDTTKSRKLNHTIKMMMTTRKTSLTPMTTMAYMNLPFCRMWVRVKRSRMESMERILGQVSTPPFFQARSIAC